MKKGRLEMSRGMLGMKRGLTKSLSLLLVFLMIFSSFSFADVTSGEDEIIVDVSTIDFERAFDADSDNKLSDNLINLEVDDEEEVRLIVEFNKAPIIQTATERGIKVTDLNESTVNSLTNEIDAEQTTAIQRIDTEVESLQVHERFDTVFNGVSMTVQYKDVKKIAGLSNVKAVYIANEYFRPESLPNMSNSFNITNSTYANEELGFKGEGLVVSVIDSGVDPFHKDMQIDPTQYEVALDAADVASIIASDTLPGTYFSAKIPYGYNYMDKDSEIRDLGPEASMHGMHVAGTVAADGELKGVAPKAQVLAMKVFGNDPEFPSTFGDIIIAAIDDSIALGADVMNLSLGSPAAFVNPDDPEQQAIKRATENGIVMSISSGNEALFGNGHSLPYASNPDIGVSGSPGLVYESIQVASVDNYGNLYNNTVNFEGIADPVMGYGKDAWNGSFELVAIGGSKLGKPEDYDGLDVTGKVVLVSRGAMSFFDKTENAHAKGAIGIVVYDHGLSTFYKNQGGWSVPFMKISRESGLALEELLKTNDAVSFTVTNESYVNPTSGKLSSFSSWGVTPDMGFKPDISAPGGNIYSLANNNEYQYMSGTSMAAPHVAGGAALVQERIKEDPNLIKLGLSEQDLTDFAKNILMNTAVPVEDEHAYTSPRGQGAGSMDLRLALTTMGVAYEKNTGLAKVNLGEITNGKATYKIKVQNFGNEELAYDVKVFTQAQISNGVLNAVKSAPLSGVDTKVYLGNTLLDGPIVLKGNQKKTIKIVQDFTGATMSGTPFGDLWPNGGFVEGFVFLSPADDYRDDYAELTAAANKAIADNQALINTLTDEIAQLEAQVPVKEEAIANINTQIADLQAQIDAKQVEIDQYKADNADAVAEVLELLSKIETAEGNVNTAVEAYEAAKVALIENAQAYSITTLFQGNYDFLSSMFNFIDEIENPSWNDTLSAELRASLEAKINDIISVLNEYEAVVNGLTVEGFLDMSEEERETFLKGLTDKVEALQEDLEAIESMIGNFKFAEYANWIDTEIIPDLEAKVADLQAQLEEALEEDKPEIQERIDKGLAVIEMAKTESANAKTMAAFVANVKEGITLNAVILDKSKDLTDNALIVDNAKAALSLLQATYTEMDLSVYETYQAGLKALEDEKKALEDNKAALDVAALEAELVTLNENITNKKAEKTTAEGLVEGLELAAKDALDNEKAFGEMVDRTVELSVPFMGFYGEWDDAPMFDAPSNSADTFYGYTGMVHVMNPAGQQSLLMDVNAISPNGDGYQDIFQPIISMVRNAKNFQAQIVKDGKVIKVLTMKDALRKNYHDGSKPKYRFFPDNAFDGMVDFKVVDEGEYFLRYTAELDNGHVQKLDIPFLVDVTKPTVGMHSYSTKTKIFSISSLDNLSGVKKYYLFEPVFDDNYDVVDIKPLLNNTTGIFDLNDLNEIPTMVMYAVEDNASNTVIYNKVIQLVDYSVPEMTMSIKAFGVIDTRTVAYTGTLFDVLPSTVTIDGNVVGLKDEGQGNYSFSGTAEFDSDGKKGIFVEAKDLAGNRVAFTRWFYIDSMASEIEVKNGSTEYTPDEVVYLPYGTESKDFDIKVSDNFPSMTVKVNGSVDYFVEHDYVSYEDQIQPVEHTLIKTLNLDPKLNRLEVSVEDAAGTVTTENYYFYVLNEAGEVPEATTLSISGDDTVQAVYGSVIEKQYNTTLVDQFGDSFKSNDELEWSVVGENVSITDGGLLKVADSASGQITVKAEQGSLVAQHTVNVTPIPASVVTTLEISGANTLQAVTGQSITSQYTVTAKDQYNNAISVTPVWSVDGDNVSIDNGLLTVEGTASGEKTIKATADGVEATFVVNVTAAAPVVTTLEISGANTLQAISGQSITSQYTVVAKDQYNDAISVTPVWTVTGDNVSINNGLLTVEATASGQKTIKATVDGVEATFAVNVTAAVVNNNSGGSVVTPVTPSGGSTNTTVNTVNVNLNQSSLELEVGTEAEQSVAVLQATVSGTNDSTVVWTSSDDSIATVDANGLVTAVAPGTVTITASRENGTESASATVEVFLVGDEETPLGAVEFSQPYMNGYKDGTFRPEGTITRAELAVIYSNILGLNTAIANKTNFEDVKGHWALSHVEAAARVGIFTGYSDGTFKPDQPVNRGELAATFSKFWALKNIDVSTDAVESLTDVSDHWASAHIYKLVNAKVLESDLAKYEPEAPATRGQVVVMINNLLGRKSLEVSESKFKDVKDLDVMGAIEAATSIMVDENK